MKIALRMTLRKTTFENPIDNFGLCGAFYDPERANAMVKERSL